MNLAWVMAVAVALGADAFSLSLAIGLTGIKKRMILRLALVVGAFHVIMPLGGMALGQALGAMLGRYAGGLGALILIALGGRIVYKVYRPGKECYTFQEARDVFFRHTLPPHISLQGFGVYALAVSVSLDALSVGFSLGTLRADLFLTVISIGVVAGVMTGLGLVLGRVIGSRLLGNKAELLGGVALLLIGLKLFF